MRSAPVALQASCCVDSECFPHRVGSVLRDITKLLQIWQQRVAPDSGKHLNLSGYWRLFDLSCRTARESGQP